MKSVKRWKTTVGRKSQSRTVTVVEAEDFDRVIAERNALQLMLNERDEQNHSLEQRRHAEQQACQAIERRVKELEGLMQGWLDLFPKQGVTGGPITIMKERTVSALNPTAEAVSHE